MNKNLCLNNSEKDWLLRVRSIIKDPLPKIPTPPNDEIWYTSINKSVVVPAKTEIGETFIPLSNEALSNEEYISIFGANLISNTYENGKGIIKFDGEVTKVGNYTTEGSVLIGGFIGNDKLTTIILPESVTSIGPYAFYGCINLIYINSLGTSIIYPSAITESINLTSLIVHGKNCLTTVTYTPKQILEICYNRITKKHQSMSEELEEEIYPKLRALSESAYKTRIREKGLDITTHKSTYASYFDEPEEELFKIDLSYYSHINLEIPNVLSGMCHFNLINPLKTVTVDGYDVFKMKLFELTGGEGDPDELNALGEYIKDHVVLLISKNCDGPHIIYGEEEVVNYYWDSNDYSIGYLDDEGQFTTTPPERISSIEVWEFFVSREVISLGLFGRTDSQINDRVDQAVFEARKYPMKIFRGDFSDFAVLDDIKVPLSLIQADILINLDTYLSVID